MTIKCDLTQRIQVQQCKLRLLRGGFSNTVIVLKHGDKKEGLGERIYSVSLSCFFFFVGLLLKTIRFLILTLRLLSWDL